jgi:fumarate hydratase subunit beta
MTGMSSASSEAASMSTLHRITLPFTEESVRKLRVDDHVILDGEIVITAGLPTHQRILDHIVSGKALPIDLTGAAFFHLGSYSRDTDGVFDVLYMNPTTSTRFNPFMPTLIRKLGLRAVGGKGGLDAECAKAMQEVGCVYLSFLGGGAPLLSEAIKEIVSVSWDDLVSHYRLVKLRVEELGPLVVAIDAHGNSKFDMLGEEARRLLPDLMAELNEGRENFERRAKLQGGRE